MTQTLSPPANPLVSLIIPVYNEEDNLPVLLEEIRKAMAAQDRGWEALLVDDGSRDNSLQVIEYIKVSFYSCTFLHKSLMNCLNSVENYLVFILKNFIPFLFFH